MFGFSAIFVHYTILIGKGANITDHFIAIINKASMSHKLQCSCSQVVSQDPLDTPGPSGRLSETSDPPQRHFEVIWAIWLVTNFRGQWIFQQG